MSTARDRGWGDPGRPGSAQGQRFRAEHIVRIDVGGVALYVNKRAARLFRGFIAYIVKRGYDISGRADDWGYAHRAIRGYEDEYERTRDPRYLSNHSWGLAVDLNAQDHPLGRRGTGVPGWVVDEGTRWGLSWGGDYANRPDEMHWEFLGRPEDVSRHPSQQEDIDIMDPTTRAYFDQQFAAANGRLDVIEQEVAILRNAVKGVNSTGGQSWLGARVTEIKASLKDILEKVG